MTLHDKLLSEFIEQFTYLDKEGNPRLNNKSPRKLKRFLSSALKKQKDTLVLDEEEIVNLMPQEWAKYKCVVIANKIIQHQKQKEQI